MRGILLFAASCVVAIALLGAIGWGFTDSAGRQAMVTSAVLAVVVQLLAFTLARQLLPKHLLLGWGLGAALRLVALVLYGVVVAKLTGGPLAPALLSFAGFLFVTTVFEPVFLKR